MTMNPLTCALFRCPAKLLWKNLFFLYHPETKLLRQLGTISKNSFNDYEKGRASFNLTIPEKFNFASDVVDVWSAKEKDGKRDASIPAFWYVPENGQEVKWNFQSLEHETKRVANMLQELCSLKRGDYVFVMLPKVPEYWLVNIAAIRIGAVLSPASMMLTSKDLSYRLSALKPSCIVAHETVAGLVDEVADSCSSLKTKIIVSESNCSRKGWVDFHDLQRSAKADHKCAETRSDESMMIFFTSGTTGQPKMAEHSHSFGFAHTLTGKYFIDLTKDDIFWNMSDTGWAKTAYGSIFSPWLFGSCAFVHRMPRFLPSTTLQVLSKYPIDIFCGPPMVYRAMIQENLSNYKFPKLSHCITGGESLSIEVANKWESATGLKIYEAYGQTETVMCVGMFKCLEYRPGSFGKPAPGLDVVILDENENEVGPGVEGEIALKKRQGKIFGLFRGYKNDLEKTKMYLTEKYFHTGDMAYYDEDGYFWFVGRNDDLINSAGYRIGPNEVEGALMEHPGVVEVAVTSSPDQDRGEVVKAFIVLNSVYADKDKSELIKELQEHTKKATAPYKYPRKIEFLKEMPKTTSGKIKRFELRKMEWKKA